MQNKENKIKIGYIDTLIFKVRFPNKAKKLKTILDAVKDMQNEYDMLLI